MAEEWFRSPSWTPDARAEFERRLARARPGNRDQYRRIKAVALEEAGEITGARELWRRILQSDSELAGLEHATALEALGDSHRHDDPDAAERFYRRLLVQHPTPPRTPSSRPRDTAQVAGTTSPYAARRAAPPRGDAERPGQRVLTGSFVLIVLAETKFNAFRTSEPPPDRPATASTPSRRRCVTDSLRRQVIERYTQGNVSARKVGEELDLGKSAVLQILKEADVAVRPQGRRLT